MSRIKLAALPPRSSHLGALSRTDEPELGVRRWAEMGARILGGCCGTTPEHIRALAVEFS